MTDTPPPLPDPLDVEGDLRKMAEAATLQLVSHVQAAMQDGSLSMVRGLRLLKLIGTTQQRLISEITGSIDEDDNGGDPEDYPRRGLVGMRPWRPPQNTLENVLAESIGPLMDLVGERVKTRGTMPRERRIEHLTVALRHAKEAGNDPEIVDPIRIELRALLDEGRTAVPGVARASALDVAPISITPTPEESSP